MITVWGLERILAKPFDWALSPFANTHPLLPLALMALASSVLFLLVLRWLSDQNSLEQIKGKIQAHFLELKLFRHDVRTVWSAERAIVRYNLLYLTYLLKPLVVTLPIFVLFLAELEAWYTSRPLKVGEAVVVSVFARPDSGDSLGSMRIASAGALRVETPPLRSQEGSRADWRIRATEAGGHDLKFIVAGSEGPTQVSKRVQVGRQRVSYVARTRSGPSFLSGFENSRESPLSSDSPIARIEVDYPSATLAVAGWEVNWVVAFVVLSLVFAFLLKRPFGIVL